MVLERYPDAVIRDATSPLTGIQRACKFPPSIAEVVEFCDETQRRMNFSQDWDKRSREQLKEREQFQEEQKAEPLSKRMEVAARIKAELAQHGMHILETNRDKLDRSNSQFRRFSDDDLRSIYSKKDVA